jgi:hypothetical protein
MKKEEIIDEEPEDFEDDELDKVVDDLDFDEA